MITNILLVAALWLVAFVASGLAILLLVLGQGRRLWLCGLFAFTGTVIGAMGLSSWTPFGFFPEIGYTWSSDTSQFLIRSGWLFAAPLVLGVIALLLVLWRSRKSRPVA